MTMDSRSTTDVLAEKILDSAPMRRAKQKEGFLMKLTEEMRKNLIELDRYMKNLAEEHSIKINKAYLDKLEEIRSKSRTLIRIIGYLSDLEKIERGELHPTKNENNLSEIVTRVVASVKQDALKRGVTITTDLKDISCSCDKNRIDQALSTLVLNAIDFSAKENGKVDVILRQENNNAEIIVKDNGGGITKESLGKIFDKFYQLDLDIDRDHSEAGFGLPICKGIIEAHDGKIWAESKGWQVGGTEIHVLLPITTKDSSELRKV